MDDCGLTIVNPQSSTCLPVTDLHTHFAGPDAFCIRKLADLTANIAFVADLCLFSRCVDKTVAILIMRERKI
jgi:hypothetical protein